MDDDLRFFGGIVAIFAGIILTVSLVAKLIMGEYTKRDLVYINHGYTKAMVVGYGEPIWVLPDSTRK